MSLFSEKHEQERITRQQQQQQQELNLEADRQSNNSTTLSIVRQHYDRQEEYLAAQRAAFEAIQVGRETLETTERQAEQLQNAESMAEETEYKFDRANRILRGMTWTGWLQNKFARDVEPPQLATTNTAITNGNGSNVDSNLLGPPMIYDGIPESCSAAGQAIQNYHANLQVLEECETKEQKETCKLICDNMYRHARSELQCLVTCYRQSTSDQRDSSGQSSPSSPSILLSSSAKNWTSRLEHDLASLQQRQLALQQVQNGLARSFAELHSSLDPSFHNNNGTSKEMLLHSGNGSRAQPSTSSSTSRSSPQKTAVDIIAQRQEEHLDSMARHLHELGSLASNINLSLEKQGGTLNSLDEKNDSIMFKSKMVTRRTDHLIQNRAWIKDKPEFVRYASMQHVPSGRFLSVAPNNDTTLVLTSNKLTDRCIFGIWSRGGANKNGKRAHQIFGFQNQYNKRWAGQSLLGQLSCSASTFGRREEWDADEKEDVWTTTGTALVVCSAGWGTGGYLLLSGDGDAANPKNLPAIGGGGLQDKKNAPKWIIHPFEKKR